MHKSIYQEDSPEYYEEHMILTAPLFTLSTPRLGRNNPDSRIEVTKETAEQEATRIFSLYPQIDAILLYAIKLDTHRQAQVATILPVGAKPRNFPGKIKPRQWIVGSDSWWKIATS
jgi:hypothetical protein